MTQDNLVHDSSRSVLPNSESVFSSDPSQNAEQTPNTEPEITHLTEEEEQYFAQVLHIGRNHKTVQFAGHEIELQTLSIDEELQVGIIAGKHSNSISQAKAYRAAKAAAGIRSIDNEPLYIPLGLDDKEGVVHHKFEQLKKYYAPFVDWVYDQLELMELETYKLLEKLKKANS